MQYEILGTNCLTQIKDIPNNAFLVEDQWDDWFQYSTMYDLYIIDDNATRHYIGKVKIGQFNMAAGQKRPNIPNKFSQLDSQFFCVGQDSHYYENIRALGDFVRKSILIQLNDVAFDEKLLKKCKNENVTSTSLFRDFTINTVTGQFRRIALGGARLTKYNFEYTSATIDENTSPMTLQFDVIPESFPPTNIHVLIGRNGVGKTFLINNMIQSIIQVRNKNPGWGTTSFINDSDEPAEHFSRIIFVSFSAFDECKISTKSQKFIRIGLPLAGHVSEETTQAELTKDFTSSFTTCVFGPQGELLKSTLKTLASDPMFSESDILKFCDKEFFSKEEISSTFSRLSSGHKIILLSVTKLIEKVQKKTLVFLDEPEGHLHPPLLSAFTRALSELLIDKNGIAIIATHSPVILQEIPRSCVWKLRRSGGFCEGERLAIESFGEDITSLTSEIFGLEVTDSGFHALLKKMVDQYGNYDEIFEKFNGKIGSEGKALLRTMLALRGEGS